MRVEIVFSAAIYLSFRRKTVPLCKRQISDDNHANTSHGKSAVPATRKLHATHGLTPLPYPATDSTLDGHLLSGSHHRLSASGRYRRLCFCLHGTALHLLQSLHGKVVTSHTGHHQLHPVGHSNRPHPLLRGRRSGHCQPSVPS